jgi:hypothetical protein
MPGGAPPGLREGGKMWVNAIAGPVQGRLPWHRRMDKISSFTPSTALRAVQQIEPALAKACYRKLADDVSRSSQAGRGRPTQRGSGSVTPAYGNVHTGPRYPLGGFCISDRINVLISVCKIQ